MPRPVRFSGRNGDGGAARALGERWPQLGFVDHAVFFTPRALGEALRRSGLVAIEITTVLAWEYLGARERLVPRLSRTGGGAC